MSRLLPLSVCLGALCLGCERPEATVVLANELRTGWQDFPHRLSVLELSSARAGESRVRVSGQLNGGDFGSLDLPRVRYGLTAVRSRALASEEGSATLEIPPGAQVEGEPFSARAEVRLPAGSLQGAGVLVAVVRGVRLSSNEYAQPPPFQTAAVLPYDPAQGYTSQGLGLSLGPPRLEGREVVLEVRARNTLGTCDRPDMNAAIPQATTWLRVDFTVVGVVGAQGAVERAAADYTLSTPTYGTRTAHPHAKEEEQRVRLGGRPGLPKALFALTGFDVWINVEGKHDPACAVIQDAVSPVGVTASGPGRYVRDLAVRLSDTSYEAASGEGEALLDVYLSNSSSFHEEGNLCLSMRAEAAMLQFDDPEASVASPGPALLPLESGRAGELEVSF